MPSIDIRHEHDLPVKEAKAKVTKVAQEIGARFDLTTSWKGDTLHFQRPGVTGQIALEPGAVHVTAELGFLLSMLKPTVEKEIEKRLAEHFG